MQKTVQSTSYHVIFFLLLYYCLYISTPLFISIQFASSFWWSRHMTNSKSFSVVSGYNSLGFVVVDFVGNSQEELQCRVESFKTYAWSYRSLFKLVSLVLICSSHLITSKTLFCHSKCFYVLYTQILYSLAPLFIICLSYSKM